MSTHLRQSWGRLVEGAGGVVTRGLVLTEMPRSFVDKIVAGRVTAQDFVKEMSRNDGYGSSGLGNYWADATIMEEPPDAYAYAEEFAKDYLEEGDNTGEISVIIVADKPKNYGSDDWMTEGDAWVPEGEPMHLREIRYNAGWGWKVLPARGIVAKA